MSLPVPELAHPKDAQADNSNDQQMETDDALSAQTSALSQIHPQKPILKVSILQSQHHRRRQIRRKASEGSKMSPISTRTLDRSQSLELPTKTQAQIEAEADTGMEVLEDLCVGVSSLDMTPLLTGAVTSIDQWLDLSTPPPPPSSSS